MVEQLRKPIASAAAWTRDDLERDRSWIVQLTGEHVRELEAAARAVQSKGLRPGDFNREDFPLPSLQTVLDKVLDELESGRGAVVIKGVPVAAADETGGSTMLWGMGTYLGRALRQHARVNPAGYKDDLIGHIIDQGFDHREPNMDRSRTSAEQSAHCDPSDLVALLCMRPATNGGVSHIVSAMTIYNELLKNHPDLIDSLYQGFHHNLRGRGANIEITPHRVPVFSFFEGHLSCNFNSATAEEAVEKLGKPMPVKDRQALDAMLALTVRPDLVHTMTLETGDVQLLNNYCVLHCRTAWQDPPEIEKKRLMIRLWLKSRKARPLAPDFVGGYVTGARHDVGVQAAAEA